MISRNKISRNNRSQPRFTTTMPQAVAARLPEDAAGYVAELLTQYPVDLWVVPRRVTKLGDHRPPNAVVPWHRITINDDLNPYAFLVTLLHELAHLATHAEHAGRRRRLQPHGREWQHQFTRIIGPVVTEGLVPDDICRALRASLLRPRAATCSDRNLLLALTRYEQVRDGRQRVEELQVGVVFETETGRRFIRGTRLRSRYRCVEVDSGFEYRVHGLALVHAISTAD